MGPASTVMERNQYTAWFRVGVKAVGRTAVPQHAMEVVQALAVAKGAEMRFISRQTMHGTKSHADALMLTRLPRLASLAMTAA